MILETRPYVQRWPCTSYYWHLYTPAFGHAPLTISISYAPAFEVQKNAMVFTYIKTYVLMALS